MRPEDKEKVYASIRKYGDSFWNDQEAGDDWNGYLFDDILEALQKNGYDLELKKL